MSRQDANAAFALSSFLYGGNAPYIEDLYARYEADPNSVDAQWRDFFGSLTDGADIAKSARGASWKKPPVIERDELLSALYGQWAEAEKKMLKILQSNAPLGAKDAICRQLAIFGSSRSEPVLKDLLRRKETGSRGLAVEGRAV